MRKALGYSVGSVVVVGLLLTAMAAPGVGRERAQLAREEVVIRVGLKSLEQATVTVGGPSRVQVNGREMRAPVKFALRAAAKEGGGRQMVTCTAADGTVLHAGLPVSVKAAGGQSGAGELLWLDDPPKSTGEALSSSQPITVKVARGPGRSGCDPGERGQP